MQETDSVDQCVCFAAAALPHPVYLRVSVCHLCNLPSDVEWPVLWDVTQVDQMTFWDSLDTCSSLLVLVNKFSLSFLEGGYKNPLPLQSTLNILTKCFLVILLHLIAHQPFERCIIMHIKINLAYFMLFLSWWENINLLGICAFQKVAFEVLWQHALLTSNKSKDGRKVKAFI